MASNIDVTETPQLLQHEAAIQLQNLLNTTDTLKDFINSPLASLIGNISSSSSLDDASALQITLLTTILHTQEIILQKITKDHENTTDQFIAMGKSFSDLESEQGNQSFQIGNLQNTANTILNLRPRTSPQ